MNQTEINQKVDKILGLNGFLQFQVEISPEVALAWATRSLGYNEHSTQDLINIIKGCDALIPRMKYGEGNPNNGLAHHRYAVGNEYSRVIYLKVVKGYLPEEFNCQALTKALKELGEECHADEANAEETDTAYSFRFWFD